MGTRFVGIDVGAETAKLVELRREDGGLRWTRRALVEHDKEPGRRVRDALREWGWDDVAAAALCGRLSRTLSLARIPERQARAAGYRFLYPDLRPATVVSIGSHGFSVLELRDRGVEVFRESPRCSQGTGNFLRQLVERFGLSVEEASAACAGIDDPAPLSGRCPVILKTDMTHLANAGQARDRILAGLYDAVAENVQVLLKPALAPPRILLLGGVTRSSRIRAHFARFAARRGMSLVEVDPEEALFLDALGCAALAEAEGTRDLPTLDALLAPAACAELETVPPLSASLGRVRRLTAAPLPLPEDATGVDLVLGLDIGSTGSKAVALRICDRRPVWQAYRATSGDPVGAAQALVRELDAGPWGGHPVRAVGVTGSGRELVGSLLASCYGAGSVHILNEIAAHAEGARHHDPRVDTVFEIGGQDAKYIRLAEGRVVDAAMNEACSAGTGSFIEEQGRRFSGVRDVAGLGEEALAADAGVSLGQHCSVFMAEVIDEAVAAGVTRGRIIAGIYDSIVRNYLNRVKGPRSVGQVVFCQGMPFASDALAAATARGTGAEVVVPPDPGTIGALGIALLTHRERLADEHDDRLPPPIDLRRFLEARVLARDGFVCRATKGCGEPGNRCRIERISTRVEGRRGRFTWGGGCSLFDRGTGRTKLPDRAPDPFTAREALVDALLDDLRARPAGAGPRPTIALTDEFMLKGLFPFFATFLDGLGLELVVQRGAGRRLLKRGIEEANVPFCAPMQQFHGLVAALADLRPDLLFLPMLRSLPRQAGEPNSTLCPVVQGSADLLRWDLEALGQLDTTKVVSPVLDVGLAGLDSEPFSGGCRSLAAELGVVGPAWRDAFVRALAVQAAFERSCLALGEEALAFCADRHLRPIVVLGRPYTIYNRVLNSNVPAILREQGALPIPVDCYPVADGTPAFDSVFWGHAQRSLRAAHDVRRTPGVWSLWCSNYACGPDSFALHLYAYAMEGKPWAVIETDGHSGDAGTRTRVEAFLHCVREDLTAATSGPAATLTRLEEGRAQLPDLIERGELVLIPRMGPVAEILAACLRSAGVRAESLPMPDRDALRIGRRHTSGKECVPMCLTLGSLLQRLEADAEGSQRYAFFMPTARGPCRFGAYNVLHKAVLERLGWSHRVRVWSPDDDGYFRGVPRGIEVLVLAGATASDLLLEALNHTRPAERVPGSAKAVYDRRHAELIELVERAGRGGLGLARALAEVARGTLFGGAALLRDAAAELAALCRPVALPTVAVVGEIYVRCDPFANDHLIERLEARGLRVRLAPFTEWLEYQDFINVVVGRERDLGNWLSSKVRAAVQVLSYRAVASRLGWPPRTTVSQTLDAAEPFLRRELEGEAVLTIGGPLHEYRAGLIDGVVNVGPLECMPAKLAEAQLFHAGEREGLLALTLSVHGDPIDPEQLESFVFEAKRRFRARTEGRQSRGGYNFEKGATIAARPPSERASRPAP